ncbi:glycosyltransferase [Candidatus Roizmanbacteria bacterium]|nr:glycosyltransferase [Candidatus Roizmanbacteria bacterium]
MRKAVIVLPTYNEVGNIERVVTQIFSTVKDVKNWEIHILVVDSKSPDGTEEKVEKLMRRYSQLHLLRIEKEGLGRAYTLGFQAAIEKLSPYLLFEMDADLSHDPKEILNFLREIEKGADFVVGSKYIKGGSIPKTWQLHRKMYSICANIFIRFGFMKLNIHDWTNGYRAVKTWVIKNSMSHIKNYSGYVFQIALLNYAVKNKAVIKEIPIQFADRKSGVSKIQPFQYILSIFLYIFFHSSFIKFAIVGFIGFVVDFVISYLAIEKANIAIWVSTLISTETAIISNFFLNNFWSFAYKKLDNNLRTYIPSFIKFNVVSSGSIAIQTVAVQLLANFFGRRFWYIYKILIIILIIIPYSYILYNKFIWKEK